MGLIARYRAAAAFFERRADDQRTSEVNKRLKRAKLAPLIDDEEKAIALLSFTDAKSKINTQLASMTIAAVAFFIAALLALDAFKAKALPAAGPSTRTSGVSEDLQQLGLAIVLLVVVVMVVVAGVSLLSNEMAAHSAALEIAKVRATSTQQTSAAAQISAAVQTAPSTPKQRPVFALIHISK